MSFEETAKAQDAVDPLRQQQHLRRRRRWSARRRTPSTDPSAASTSPSAAPATRQSPSASTQTGRNRWSPPFEDFVESYNSLRDDLDKLTAFDGEAMTTGLPIRHERGALQIDTPALHGYHRPLRRRWETCQSLEQLGLSLAGGDGKLELNKTKLKSAFESDPAGVQEFLSNAQRASQ